MVSTAQRRKRERGVCLLGAGIEQVQCLIVPGVACEVLGEFGQRRGWRGMIEIPGDEEDAVGVLCLQPGHC